MSRHQKYSAPPPFEMIVRAADPWYDANLDGTYNFVQMYRSYPVYKVSNLIIFL